MWEVILLICTCIGQSRAVGTDLRELDQVLFRPRLIHLRVDGDSVVTLLLCCFSFGAVYRRRQIYLLPAHFSRQKLLLLVSPLMLYLPLDAPVEHLMASHP